MNKVFIEAKTHGAEYSWHKYWSRKPSNVISQYLNLLVPQNGLVVDPFNGSGVVLNEAHKLGFTAIGFDVNPIAVEISNFLLDTVNSFEFQQTAVTLINEIQTNNPGIYQTLRGEDIRFLIHNIVTQCSGCNERIVFEKDIHGANGKKCQFCGKRLNFNLSNLHSTQISQIMLIDGTILNDSKEIEHQMMQSNTKLLLNKDYLGHFAENKRTLTSNVLKINDFFTNRNYGLLSQYCNATEQTSEDKLRRALLLLVTSTSAQVSRLIASRNNLSTGGQAWTIPGFWVPPIHVESNPFIHLNARVKKMVAALKAVEMGNDNKSNAKSYLISAENGLDRLKNDNQKVDLVFLDPPYGDSVAFLEFSSIWNGFIVDSQSFEQDISISNRTDQPFSPGDYALAINNVFSKIERILKPEGKILLTFNNNDLESWKSIVSAAQQNLFSAVQVNYQDPAVISSKSQTAVEGSYLGDFYVIFQRSKSLPLSLEEEKENLIRFLKNVVSSRANKITPVTLYKFSLEYWLEKNIDAQYIDSLKEILESNFVIKDNLVVLENPSNITQIKELVLRIFQAHQSSPDFDISKIMEGSYTEFVEFGIPALSEIKAIIQKSKVIENINNHEINQLEINY